MSRFQIIWMSVAGLWVAALGLFVSNVESIDAFRKSVAEADTIAAYQSFLVQSSPQAKAAEKELGTFYQPIDSVDFGLLFLEEELFWLAKTHELENFAFAAEKPAAGSQQASLDITVSGSLKELVALLEVLEGDYPFLVLQGVSGGGTVYHVRLLYYFRVATA